MVLLTHCNRAILFPMQFQPVHLNGLKFFKTFFQLPVHTHGVYYLKLRKIFLYRQLHLDDRCATYVTHQICFSDLILGNLLQFQKFNSVPCLLYWYELSGPNMSGLLIINVRNMVDSTFDFVVASFWSKLFRVLVLVFKFFMRFLCVNE